MATNHTENYALNLWQPQDDFLREEFNENSQKIDAAVAALTQTVGKKLELTMGTYVGTGDYGENSPTSVDFAQATGGKPPLLVMVAPAEGNEYCFWAIRGQKITYVHDSSDCAHYPCCYLTWTDTGLSWHANYAVYQMNAKDAVYLYIALF